SDAAVLSLFFNDTATTEIYTLSLHDALPIWSPEQHHNRRSRRVGRSEEPHRSEEHTSELQSLAYLVCRLLLEKTKQKSHLQELLRVFVDRQDSLLYSTHV